MRRYLTVFMLFVRGTIYRVLLIIAAMLTVEGILVYGMFREYSEAVLKNPGGIYSITEMLREAHLVWVLLIGFLLVTATLSLFGCDFRGKLEYTMQRLGISPNAVFYLQAVYNALVYLLLWMVQVYALFGFCMYYVKYADPSLVTNQTLFLEFHRSDLLFSLFPLENGLGWAMNICAILGMGIVTARIPRCQRQKCKVIAIVFMLMWLTGIWPWGNIGDNNLIAIIGVIFIAGLSIFCLYVSDPGLDAE